MPDLMSDRIRIVMTLAYERCQPYPNEAIVQACETAIRSIDRDPRMHKSYIEHTLGNDE